MANRFLARIHICIVPLALFYNQDHNTEVQSVMLVADKPALLSVALEGTSSSEQQQEFRKVGVTQCAYSLFDSL